MTERATREFQATVLEYYQAHRRYMPWREPDATGTFDGYAILVSEIMLQQTQVTRVIPKFEAFMAAFPTVESLASAELGDVLTLWNGLGYNRRAKFLWLAAQSIMSQHGGRVPDSLTDLKALPGIGKNTAGAILAYTYNQPAIFVETNIRTVYLHHFWPDGRQIADEELLPVIAQTLPRDIDPREWYWALMDYGSHLKASGLGGLARSKHYVRQSKFAGSRRQLRGAILRELIRHPLSKHELEQALPDPRLDMVLSELLGESLIRDIDGRYTL